MHGQQNKKKLINHHLHGNVNMGEKVELHAILTLTINGGDWSVLRRCHCALMEGSYWRGDRVGRRIKLGMHPSRNEHLRHDSCLI